MLPIALPVEAAVKLVGGVNYTYAVRGDGQPTNEVLSEAKKKEALDAVLKTLDPTFLRLPEKVIALIPPQPIGFQRNRELFKVHTGLTFDPMGAAEASANFSLTLLMQPNRIARVAEQHAREKIRYSPNQYFGEIHKALRARMSHSRFEKAIGDNSERLFLQHLLRLANHKGGAQSVTAAALNYIRQWEETLGAVSSDQDTYLQFQIQQFFNDPSQYKMPEVPSLPDGSPIGCGH